MTGILGPRQVGNTTLVNLIRNHLSKDTIYLDLELDSDYFKLNEPELFLSQHRDKCVIIDEIQRKPNLFPLLRALVDQHPENGRFIILGSVSPALLRQSATLIKQLHVVIDGKSASKFACASN